VRTELDLGLADAPLELRDERVLLVLQRGADLRELALQPPAAGVRDLCQPLGQHGLRLAREVLYRPVELTREPLRRALARALDLVRELL
jgi:hypothetical protein